MLSLAAQTDSTFFFLSCGQTALYKQAYADFADCVARYVLTDVWPTAAADFRTFRNGITTVILFTAPDFLRTYVTPFVVAYVQGVVIACAPWRDELCWILGASYRMGRHTDIVILSKPTTPGKPYDSEVYLWANQKIKPYGVSAPYQCLPCGTLNHVRVKGDMFATDENMKQKCYTCGVTQEAKRSPYWVNAKKYHFCGNGAFWLRAPFPYSHDM